MEPDEDELERLAPGTVLGERYDVHEFLGRGGMGAVYAVHDYQLEEDVALKLLHPRLAKDQSYRARLRGEVRVARRVSHPNVCRVHDLGADGARLFVTMELVRGESVRRLLRRGAMPLPLAVDLIVQLCGALAAAHRAGVLHRDVKPDNVVYGDGRAVLTDFGVAGLVADPSLARLLAGTPSYIAPEVLRGEPFDARSDVYGAAVVAYELFAGRTPFPARSLDDATRRATTRPTPLPLPAETAPPSVRAALDRALAHGLDFDPAHRTAGAEQLAEMIANAARGAGTSARTRPIEDDAFTPTTPGAVRVIARRGPELRVATVLVFRCEALGDAEAAADEGSSEGDTHLVPLSVPGEDLERVVVDLGGTPVDVGAMEITALFGAPQSLGDDAARAARAARQLIDRTRGGRAGIDTTRVMLRGGTHELASTDALAVAQALCAAAATGDVLVSAPAGRQLAAHHDLEAFGDVGGARALRVIGARPAAPTAQVETWRARELAQLEALALRCFAERRPRVVHVRAPSGYGKTRLREALVARLAGRREIDWLVAAAQPLGETAPLGLLRAADPAWFAASVRAGLADRGAVLASARRWLEARATPRPVAALFEDVQWADAMSRELLESLATSLDDVPIFVVTFGRSGEDAPHGGDVITLHPLDDGAATQLARQHAPAAPDEAIADLVARAAGNPFFVEELARDLGERGAAAQVHATTTTFTPLPATVEAAVQARLDRLPADAREVASAAAVVGRWFWRDAIARALPRPLGDADLDDALAELERRGLIAPVAPALVDDDRYRFAEGLVRDVAYQRMNARERRVAHAEVASWLERRAVPDDPDVLLAIAHHRDLAGDAPAAALAYRSAGRRCLELFAYREAAPALRRAAQLGTTDRELAEMLGDAAAEGATLDEADTCYAQALELARGDAPREAHLLYKLGTIASRRGDAPKAIERFEQGLALAVTRGGAAWAEADPRILALLDGQLGWVLGYQLGDERGLAHCERAVARLEGTTHKRDLAHALSRLGATYMRAGRFRDQLGCNERNLAIAEEVGDLFMQTVAHINLGVVLSVLGDLTGAIDHTRAADRLCARTGSRTTAALVASNLGGYLLEEGALEEAEEAVTDGIARAERVGDRRILPESFQFMARIRAARGDRAGALRWAQQSLAVGTEQGSRMDQGIARRIIAVLGALDQRQDALDEIERARTIVAGTDALEEARTEAAFARVLALLGRDPSAPRAAARAVFERLGARRDLAVLDDDHEIR
ncbi:MAG TPA: protein kinase [Kofleriaceae bacterium]|nr:protein kinase [Kofleriaceae bacterium]